MSIYALSDIRGYYNKFIEMLKLIKYDSDDCLILVGNSIDKNNLDGSIKMIRWILNNYYRNPKRLFVLRGINEEMLINEIKSISYDKECRNIITALLSDGFTMNQLQELFCHMRWSLPLKRWNFANSCTCNGYNNQMDKTNYESQKDFCIYSSYHDIMQYGGSVGYQNVFGHYPTVSYYINESDKGRIVKFKKNNKHFININCGIYLPNNEGSLGCICVDNENEYYVT